MLDLYVFFTLNSKQLSKDWAQLRIRYLSWLERVVTRWFYTQLIWGSHDKLPQLGITCTFQFIDSLLYLAGKQISHQSLCRNYFWIKSKMSGRRERDITSFFVKRRKIAGSLHVLPFISLFHQFQVVLPQLPYIFQDFKVYVI